eukprot:2308427-Pyramimonas_sp.AAC.1
MSKQLTLMRVWTSTGAYWALMASPIFFSERASIFLGKPTAMSLQVFACCKRREEDLCERSELLAVEGG